MSETLSPLHELQTSLTKHVQDTTGCDVIFDGTNLDFSFKEDATIEEVYRSFQEFLSGYGGERHLYNLTTAWCNTSSCQNPSELFVHVEKDIDHNENNIFLCRMCLETTWKGKLPNDAEVTFLEVD